MTTQIAILVGLVIYGCLMRAKVSSLWIFHEAL